MWQREQAGCTRGSSQSTTDSMFGDRPESANPDHVIDAEQFVGPYPSFA